MPDSPTQALLIEPDARDAQLVRKTLGSGARLAMELVPVADVRAALEQLESREFGVALLGVKQLDREGMDDLRLLRVRAPQLPIVVLARDAGDDGAEALRQGAQDFLYKSQLDAMTLGPALRHAIERGRVRAGLQQRIVQLITDESRLSTVVENTIDGIAVVDGEGTTQFINSPGAALLGTDPQALTGKPFPYPVVTEGAIEVDLPAGRGNRTMEMWVREIKWAGHPAYLAAMREITERKSAERALQQARLQLEGQLAREQAARPETEPAEPAVDGAPVQQLESDLEQARTRLQEQNEHLAETEQGLTALREQQAASDQQARELGQELEQTRHAMQAEEQRRAEAEQALEQARRQETASRERLAELERALEEANAALQAQTQRCEQAQRDLQAAGGQQRHEQERAAKLEQALERAGRERDRLVKRVEQLQAQADGARADVDREHGARTETAQALEAARKERDRVMARMEALKAEQRAYQRTQSELDHARTERDRLAARAAELERQLNDSRERLTQAQQRHQSAEQALEGARQELAHERDQVQRTRDEMTRQQQAAEQAVSQARQALDQESQAHAAAEQTLASLRARMEEETQRSRSLEQALNENRAAVDKQTEAHREAERGLEQARQALAEEQRLHAAAEQALESLRGEHQRREGEVAERISVLQRALQRSHQALEQEAEQHRRADVELEQARRNLEHTIGECWRAEDGLRMFERVFANADEGFMITDAAGVIQSVNPAFTAITGYGTGEAVGKTPRILKSGRHGTDFYQRMWKSLAERGQWQGQAWNRRRNGEVYPQWETISAIRDRHEQVVYYVAAFHDVSEQMRREQELERQVYRDPVTGLANRRMLLDFLGLALADTPEGVRGPAVVHVRLDPDPDTFPVDGWDNEVLAASVASRLRACARRQDLPGRLSENTFAVVLPGGGADGAWRTAGQIAAVLGEPVTTGDQQFHLRPNVGVGVAPDQGGSAEALLDQARLAMQDASGGPPPTAADDPQEEPKTG